MNAQNTSMSELHRGRVEDWRVILADEALEYAADGDISTHYNPGLGYQVIHTCSNSGEPFDAARHRGARAVLDVVRQMSHDPQGEDRAHAIRHLRRVWDEA